MLPEHDDIVDREVIGHFVAIALERLQETRQAVWWRRSRDMLLEVEHHIEMVESDLVDIVSGEYRYR